MATKSVRVLHVGFMVPLKELLPENGALEREIGHLDLRTNIYAAVLFYKNTNQDTMLAWFDQRKRASRSGYLRAYYMNKRRDMVIEMDVDGKPIYLIASLNSLQAPIQLKKEVAGSHFGVRVAFAERIQVPCFAYKCETDLGFIPSDAFTAFQKEQTEKAVQQNNAAVP